MLSSSFTFCFSPQLFTYTGYCPIVLAICFAEATAELAEFITVISDIHVLISDVHCVAFTVLYTAVQSTATKA
jgi:hypothetical protein